MVKLMVYFLLRPTEAGGEEKPADLPGSSDKEGELLSCGASSVSSFLMISFPQSRSLYLFFLILFRCALN
jgi:hypothetical protein